MKKQLTSSAMILALAVSGAALPVNRAAANGHLGAAIVGALIGGAIVAGANQNRRNNARSTRSTASSAQRSEMRAIQTALNYFEFPSGAPDGVIGRRTRTAISQYQVFMSFPVNGELNGYQKDFLLTSYQRAQAGGAETSRIILTDPNGTRGLLVAFMQQQQGDTGLGAPLGGGSLQASDPFGTSPPAAPSGLPVFVTSQESSMNQLCISGIQPNSVEAQFCNLRAYAIDEGDRLATSVQGASRAEIQAQCEGFAPSLEPYISTVSLSATNRAKGDLQAWVRDSGATPAALEGIAKVCLGVGYSTDNATVALASVLSLVGLGQGGYDELLAYHLALGFGFGGKSNTERGADWLDGVSLAYASGLQTITGENGAARAVVAVSLANSMRGLPVAPANGVLPAFAPTNQAPVNTGGGFFSSGASN